MAHAACATWPLAPYPARETSGADAAIASSSRSNSCRGVSVGTISKRAMRMGSVVLREQAERRLAVLVEAEAVDAAGLLEVDRRDARVVRARVRAVGAEGPGEGHDGAVRDALGGLARVRVLDRGAAAELRQRLELAVVRAAGAEVGEAAAAAGVDARRAGAEAWASIDQPWRCSERRPPGEAS